MYLIRIPEINLIRVSRKDFSKICLNISEQKHLNIYPDEEVHSYQIYIDEYESSYI